MLIQCSLSEFSYRTVEVDREYEDKFEKSIVVYGRPGVAIYPKEKWRRVSKYLSEQYEEKP